MKRHAAIVSSHGDAARRNTGAILTHEAPIITATGDCWFSHAIWPSIVPDYKLIAVDSCSSGGFYG